MTNHLYDALIAPHAENDATFLVLNEIGRPAEISFRDFVGEASQLAHVLQEIGVKPGDRIVVQAPKRSEMLVLYAATLQIGAIFLPLNTGYKRDELTYFIDDAMPSLIVCTDAVAAGLVELLDQREAALLTLNSDGSGTLMRDVPTKPSSLTPVPCATDDLAALLYTSGTTGRSKGAMLSHDNLLSNARALTDLWQITSDDTLIHALPIFHTHGLFVAINTALLAGCRVRFMAGFDIDEVIAALPNSTMMMGVPTFYTRLLADARLTRQCVADIRLFVSGSAPLLAETHEAFTARTGHRILERYGMTETNMITSNPYVGARRAGTVGFALPGTEVRLTKAETGEEVTPGEIGLIEVRGPNVFRGYWRMPEKTAEELRDNGFFITGDLGQISDEGYLSIVGREKDLIITGGYNVYPKEIEDVLNDVAGVSETAVFGVPHHDFGEMIVAAYVPEEGADVEQTALAAITEEKLARFKHPRVYCVMDALPRNAMGKVQKNILRESFVAEA